MVQWNALILLLIFLLCPVLIQWQGLSPDDTSWEYWDALQEDYHLEDKVLLEALGKDREMGLESDAIMGQDNIQQMDSNPRPKRKVTKPKILEEYIL
ncbi:hypothetical protein SESBI_14391 [Sesbania bispinosa]|nr:hypothetical protein SESBI_14391 [Sesbania bispinosa]